MNNRELIARYQNELTILNNDAYHLPFGYKSQWQKQKQ